MGRGESTRMNELIAAMNGTAHALPTRRLFYQRDKTCAVRHATMCNLVVLLPCAAILLPALPALCANAASSSRPAYRSA
jgi:hypothetical protein